MASESQAKSKLDPARFGDEKRAEVLCEAYKKHAAELLAIEEAQQSLVLLLLGIFGAGATFLASEMATRVLVDGARIGLTVVVVAILALGGIYTERRNRARRTVRELLVSCEKALGFYDTDLYIRNGPLYPPAHDQFAGKGEWLGWIYWFSVLAGAGFLIVLWSAK